MHTIIRGGTDGSRLTEKGLPTPNLFTGGQNYHSLPRVGVAPGHGGRGRDLRRAGEALGERAFVRLGDVIVGVSRMNLTAEPLVAEAPHLADDRQQRAALLGQLVLDARR